MLKNKNGKFPDMKARMRSTHKRALAKSPKLSNMCSKIALLKVPKLRNNIMKSKLRYMFIISWIHRQTRRKDPYVYVDNAASKKNAQRTCCSSN